MDIISTGTAHIMSTYARFNIALVSGKGSYVYDDTGKKYLDFVAGIAVNTLGHNHKALTAAIKAHAEFIHVSNLYWTKPGAMLAEKLVANSAFSKVFFCNSGAEGVEAALKLARKIGAKTGRYEIISMENSFHGRTYGALTATGQPKYHAGFSPMLPGVRYARFNDYDSLQATDDTCAIIVEPIQGEGGIRPAAKEYLGKLRTLCDKNGWTLIFDEVQCGVGRLGTLFAHEIYGVTPDICVLAKGLAGGVPIGAMLACEKAAIFAPGDHASTFGGNPLATGAANIVLHELQNGLLENVVKQGAFLAERLNTLAAKHETIKEVIGSCNGCLPATLYPRLPLRNPPK